MQQRSEPYTLALSRRSAHSDEFVRRGNPALCPGRGRLTAVPSEHRDGEKPWSEDDLFDLESAIAWGGNIKDIADFLSREVGEIQQKAAELNLLGTQEKRQPAP